MSSAAKHALHEALRWGAVALAGFALFYFFDDLRTAFGPGAGNIPSIAGLRAERPAEERANQAGFSRDVRLKADPRGHFIFEAAINGLCHVVGVQ